MAREKEQPEDEEADDLSEAPTHGDEQEPLPAEPSEVPQMDTLRDEMRNEMAEMRGLLQNLAEAPKTEGVPAGAVAAELPLEGPVNPTS